MRVHPFNIFQGSDSKENCFTTLSDKLIHLQNLTGMIVVVDGIERKLSVEVTADFKALNMMVGRQLGRPSIISIHINTKRKKDISR